MKNLFQASKKEQDVSLQLLKKSLDRALLAYQTASKIKTAGMLHEFDPLSDIQNTIQGQRDKDGVFIVARDILNSATADPVLKFCVAVGLSSEIGLPISPVINDKTFIELQSLTKRSSRLMERVKDEMDQQLAGKVAPRVR